MTAKKRSLTSARIGFTARLISIADIAGPHVGGGAVLGAIRAFLTVNVDSDGQAPLALMKCERF